MVFEESSLDSTDEPAWRSDLSFFELVDHVPDAELPFSSGQRIQFKRSWLPVPKLFLARLEAVNLNGCDAQFSRRLAVWMQNPGGGGDSNKRRNDVFLPSNNYSVEANWKRTIGSFLRFAATVQYRLLTGSPEDFVLNIRYGGAPGQLEFPWAENVSSCTTAGGFAGWNCAFANFTTPIADDVANDDGPFAETDRDEIFRIRKERVNSSAQIVLYGKTVELYARPSKLVEDFSAKHLVSINTPACWGGPTTRRFSSYSEFEAFVAIGKKNCKGATISMQVRQGDSCDVVIQPSEMRKRRKLKDVDNFWEYSTAAGQRGRKCYAPAVYLTALLQLKALYKVRTVFLSTDSEAMVDLLTSSQEFHVVYLDISRKVFDYNASSPVWIERRSSEANELVMFSAVADLNLLKHGQAFILTLSSAFSKLAFLIAAGFQASVPPFLSLDYPFSCEILDDCNEGGRDRPLEDILGDQLDQSTVDPRLARL